MTITIEKILGIMYNWSHSIIILLKKDQMDSYPKLRKLLKDKVFISINSNTFELGKKILDTLFYKVCSITMKDQKLYKLLGNKLGETVIQAINISNVSHLLMCLGDVANKSQYEKLREIESEIERCIKSSAYQNPSSTILNKTEDQSLKTSFSQFKIVYQPGQPQAQKNNNDISQIRNQEELLDQDERNMLLELQQMSIPGIGKSFSEGQNSNNKSNLNMTDFQLPKSVEEYLKTRIKTAMTELNHVVQILKLGPSQKWKQSLQNGKFVQQYHIIVPSFRVMARDDKKISGKGIHVNKKNAREEAALQILRVLYEGFPHIYEEIARIKAERALE